MRQLLCAVLLLIGASVQAQELIADQQARFQSLTQELRCLVCQNQSISDSNAPLAQDLRAQVQAQLKAGRTDAEIKDYLVQRYGDFVLYRPPFKASTVLLWLGPLLLLAVALVTALRHQRRARRPTAAAPDADALKRLLDEQQP